MSPPDPLPSDEARWTIYTCGTSGSPYTCSCGDGDYGTECTGEYAVEVVPARREAEVRAAMLREVSADAEPKRPRNHAPWCCVEHKGPCDFNQEAE